VNAEGAVSIVLDRLQAVAKELPDHPTVRLLEGRLLGGGSTALTQTADFMAGQGDAGKPAFILGASEESGKLVTFAGEGSAITIAPPGSGKTQCHVFPTLLSWKGPAVVLDVKGEIYAGTSKWRSENVGPVYKFSPLDPATSASWNPLTAVRSDPDYLWEDSRFLADMMLVPTGGKDPFWENRARDVLTAAIARVCLQADASKRSLGDVLDVFHGVGWDKFVMSLQMTVDIRSMTRAGSSLKEMEPKTRDGVLQTGLSSLSAWDGDRIERATRKSDWSPLDLRAGTNPTIYICLKPNEIESYISVLRVFIAQHIRMLTSVLPPRGAPPILFLLDELPRLRQMPPVEEALEIGRQYGIRLWMFTQSLGQLKNAYDNAEGMVGSCAVRMYMNPSLHDETAQKISDDIGMQEGVLDNTRQKIVEAPVLAGPEYKDYVIVMASGFKPFRVRKSFAYADQSLKTRMGSL
jgi:type IV secretion system protein VirD4